MFLLVFELMIENIEILHVISITYSFFKIINLK